MKSDFENIKSYLMEILQEKNSVNLYANYIARMEENYAQYNLSKRLENFFLDYLTIYTNGKVPTKEDMFQYFVDFYTYAQKLKADENILKHIYRYSNYYLKIITLDINDVDIKDLIKKINALNAADTYSYLMEVFEDYEFAHINKNMFLDILETVIDFSIQKQSKPSQILTFAALSHELNKMLAIKDYIPNLSISEADAQEKNEAVTINSLLKNPL